MVFIIPYILLGMLASGSTSNVFKQPNFHLEFNSFDLDGLILNDMKVNELLPNLKMVSTKFSKIYTKLIFAPIRTSGYVLNNIPEAVAQHNKQNQAKLELLMTIYQNSITPSGFKKALEVANKANLISSGSVTYLLANIDDFEEKAGNLTMLGEPRELGYPYNLGVIIPFKRCETKGEYLDTNVILALENVNLVILDFVDRSAFIFRGVEESISEIKVKYEMCRKKIGMDSAVINPEVGLRVNWIAKNDSDLVEFWKRMNKWSIEEDVKVFVSQAFDLSPDRKGNEGIYYSTGRWKLVSRNGGKVKFQDKFGEEEGEDLGKKSIENRKDSRDISVIIWMVGIGCGILVGFVLLVFYRQYSRRQMALTKQEISEFYKGSESLRKNPENENYISSIEGMGYNKEYEVNKESFRLSDCPLGSGAFGEVWKGTVIKDGMEVEVAAKTLKKGCPTTTLKGFLSEIKVMGYLGQHANLVRMVGAYTKGIEKGKVIVFTELCGIGSLESYLRNLGKSLVCENYSENKTVSKKELTCFHQWCLEIANGMEYLSSKNVVHADLATRNVLLNDALNAKISDFGLSRRLYDYENYVKKQQEPLPWKWMSPESLQRLEFNEKTDVWAFGVTMWEIYSLGSTPYQGLNWTVDFSTQLLRGLRMEKPLYDDNGMYIQMIKCWNIDPSRRPSFSELKVEIRSIGKKQAHDEQTCYKNSISGNRIYQYQNN